MPGVPYSSEAERQAERARRKEAEENRRGTSARDYEGVYNSSGNYRHRDCSDFELGVARAAMGAIYMDPDGTEEDSEREVKRLARRIGLDVETIIGIYMKALEYCRLLDL